MNSHTNGISSFRGLSCGITLHSMHPLRPHLFKLSMAEPPPLLSYGDRKTLNIEVESMLKTRDLAINALKENPCVAQNQMKKMVKTPFIY